MDTNVLELILDLVAKSAAAKAAAGGSVWSNPSLVAGVVTLMAATAAYLQSRVNGVRARARDEKVEVISKTVEKVHELVNGGSHALGAKCEALSQQVLELSKENERLKEKLNAGATPRKEGTL